MSMGIYPRVCIHSCYRSRPWVSTIEHECLVRLRRDRCTFNEHSQCFISEAWHKKSTVVIIDNPAALWNSFLLETKCRKRPSGRGSGWVAKLYHLPWRKLLRGGVGDADTMRSRIVLRAGPRCVLCVPGWLLLRQQRNQPCRHAHWRGKLGFGIQQRWNVLQRNVLRCRNDESSRYLLRFRAID